MKSLISMLFALVILNACNSNSDNNEAALKAKQATIDSMKMALEKQAVVDSMNAVMAQREEERAKEEKQQVVANSYSAPAETPKKKKWNHTAKGAVVGAGTGAITGAIVNKKRGEGALIGSLIGAGVGAGTGAIVDNSKKKKEKQQ
ncbi:glycine zipper family protein [Dyadobacter sp. CY323]|uniref:glycine zipper family protein n=1 Tax=Dyadobacter sp. CY323 TaxID=2907302 RepID=UPI001F3D443F|nr:glycine zipper family protein [Dyadobacter sp. CY323]MCE6992037.1 glycine zipper family protein [Dyadobacter sp. CY323]